MKKIIISMLCILFAVPSFAQMVGASSISQKQKKTQEYSVEKHEFSIQAGGGDDFNETFVTSGIMKYKFKPSTKYDIRLLGEIGIIISDSEYPETGISTIPILFGLKQLLGFTLFTHGFPQKEGLFFRIWNSGSG
jgi:hypothetical protein